MKKAEKTIISVVSTLLHMSDKCPVIYYHDIVEDGKGDSYQKTDISVFEKQMEFISKSGLRSLTFDDLKRKPNALYERGNIVICFDDGYLSNYTTAYPICKKYNVKFNIFIEGNAVFSGNSDYMSVQQMVELHKSGLVGIGAHTWNHIDCTELSDANYQIEIEQENERLCKSLGVAAITDFCFPYGSYNESILDYLDRKKVYDRIYTSDNRKPTKRTYSSVPGRIAIENNDSEKNFADKVNGKFASYRLFKKMKNLVFRQGH